jgi:hypothetical protein
MPTDLESLVAAIKSLKQEPTYFKDYIFPIASAFFTSLLGAGIAYFVLKHQEGIQIEKDKMNSTNKWTLLAEQARSNLLAIKQNYQGNLTNSPVQRFTSIPSVLFHADPIAEHYQDLSYIVPKSEKDGTEYHKWSQIPRIRAMISNYNYLLKLWAQRNAILQPLKEEILRKYTEKAYLNVTPEEVIAAIGEANTVKIIDITERAIILTDDILLELTDFMNVFPSYAKTIINIERLKKYGSVLMYSTNGNEMLSALLKRAPVADYKSVEFLFGMDADKINERYKTGYE